MDDLLAYLWVALGGALGSVARFALGNAMVLLTGPGFPYGTLLINVVGSFVISFFGALTAMDARWPLSFEARAFVTVGVCGGFTTFSSFSLQTVDLIKHGATGRAVIYASASIILCLFACALGYLAANAVNGVREG
jgi:CrcB protein